MLETFGTILENAKLIDHTASLFIIGQGAGGLLILVSHSKARKTVVHHTIRIHRAAKRAVRQKVRKAIVSILDESRDPMPPMRKPRHFENDNFQG